MNDFKTAHTHQSLLMSMIQILGNIPVINPRHISVKYRSCQISIFLLPGHPPKKSGITGDTQYLYINTLDDISGFTDIHPFVRSAFQRPICQIHSPSIFLIRLQIFQLGTYIVSCMTACTGIHHRRSRRLLSFCMIIIFSFNIYLRCMSFPIHLQTGSKPFRPSVSIPVSPLL